MEALNNIKFDEKGLVPAIVQDVKTNEVLMLAYMNKESLEKTIETNQTWFYSRSRQKLWNKGETSGHTQELVSIDYDCDGDTLLIKVKQNGVACHTGEYSCFYNKLVNNDNKNTNIDKYVYELYNTIESRKSNPVDGSYTNYLFEKGMDKILKKVGEENAEVIIGAKNNSKEEVIYEVSDLVYHVLVLLVEMGISIDDIKKELYERHNK
ncbi:histidine biosynthesis bifunctional protein HisIE [Gottschalkia purinilytica]|uniref:Histidine biosynthesis bifunctional protein HisIE n=1 Tax=Gottschalkia purinilytica TaxID=1503 RepID=A0A0L0WFG6_GOTPU|nr:bifunctional phosphoribosyl-AMP cyclohydrolase/phosphoribosyl-ATP diphosphatase HisIE [Gottschalkia purinilytica]KNF10165.1 histidine biosynthesis bifunctional protein HisIE [Gottschalkia purinilytica]